MEKGEDAGWRRRRAKTLERKNSMNEPVKERVLLVDDEKHLLVSLRDCLIHENFEVILAQSGEEALALLEEKPGPDLIVLDISMPGMGGMGFLRRISSPEGIPSCPVLVLTARSTMKNFFDNIAVDGFLAKPCEEGKLVRKIRQILAARKAKPAKEARAVRKILLAEDDATIAHDLVTAVSRAGFEVELVKSGPEVLEKAASGRPDLILMKEILPRLNGSAVAGLMDVMPSVSTIPVVLYDETKKDQESSPRLGALRCIKKVLKTSEAAALIQAVRSVLETPAG